MKKLKQITTVLFAFALTLLAAITITGTSVQAAEPDPGYTFEASTGVLTITKNEGFKAFRESKGVVGELSEVVIGEVKTVIIAPGVTEIANAGCKNYANLTSVTIPDTVTIIRSFAFKGCASLISVSIPNCMTKLEVAAFNGTGLQEVTIPDSVTEIGSLLFANCKNLTKIKFSDNITSIPIDIVSETENLVSVELPKNLKTIEQSAFIRTALPSITIPAGVTDIGSTAFASKYLKTVIIKAVTPPTIGDTIFRSAPADFKIYVPFTPKGTVDIYKAAPGWAEYKEHIVAEPHEHVAGEWIIDTPAEGTQHTECILCGEVLQTIAIPNFKSGIYTYTATGEKTAKVTGFVKGKSTSKVTIAKSVTYQNKTYQVTEIADKAFYKNTKIKKVSIGNNVTKIGKNAFKQCSKLTDAVIGNKVKEIGTAAFYKCTSLKKVTIGTGVKQIGSHVFCHDKKLSEIVVKSNKLTKIGKHNLYNCRNLKIKVPSSKVKAYAKLFKGQGQKSSVKITK